MIISEPSIVTNTLWAFANLSDGSNEQVKDILSLGITAKLISLTLHQNKEIKIPAVRTVCNLLTADDTDTEVLLYFN